MCRAVGSENPETCPALVTMARCIVTNEAPAEALPLMTRTEVESEESHMVLPSSFVATRRFRGPSERGPVVHLAQSFLAIPATCLPWKRAMPSSFSVGWREPSTPEIVEAP